MPSDVRKVFEDVYTIGWVEFLHGKIPVTLLKMQDRHCAVARLHGMAGVSWTWQFISQLLQELHAQWLYRNFTHHHHTRGYLAMKSWVEVLEQIAELVDTPPNRIPAQSQFLLELDFSDLFLSKHERQEYWGAAIRAALKGTQTDGKRWQHRVETQRKQYQGDREVMS